MLNFFFYLTMGLFLTVALFLVLLVLIQKGRGGGLASAFGGSGGNTAFGSKTGDVLTWATSVLFGVFLVLAVVLNLLANRVHYARTGAPVTAAMPMNTRPAQPVPAVPPAAGEPGVRDERVPPAAEGAAPRDRSGAGSESMTPSTQPARPQ